MSIEFVRGSIFDQRVEALVNPVNCVGVAGKGLALEFKKQFSWAYDVYVELCRQGRVRVGEARVVSWSLFKAQIVLFPTKDHWRNPSQLEWIRDGLRSLACVVAETGIRSIAIPAIGCGCGGLLWADVKPLIVAAMDPVKGCRTVVVEP